MSLKMSSPLKDRRAFGSTKIMMGNRSLESQITFLPAISVDKVGQQCPLCTLYTFSSVPYDTKRETRWSTSAIAIYQQRCQHNELWILGRFFHKRKAHQDNGEAVKALY